MQLNLWYNLHWHWNDAIQKYLWSLDVMILWSSLYSYPDHYPSVTIQLYFRSSFTPIIWQCYKYLLYYYDMLYFKLPIALQLHFLSNLCWTSTLVVMSHESHAFSMSASFAFSWLPTWTQAYMGNMKIHLRCKHWTLITFTWRHYHIGSEKD